MRGLSGDDILAIFVSCSSGLSCRVVPGGRGSPELAESNSAILIRIIISLFSTAVMEHYPRNFPKVRAHLGKGLFDVVVERAILVPNC